MGRCRDCVAGLLGVCRGDFCEAERVGLVERAEVAAEELGHELGDFIKVRGEPLWRCECRRCTMHVTITIDPAVGTPGIWGEAVSVRCTPTERAPGSLLVEPAAG